MLAIKHCGNLKGGGRGEVRGRGCGEQGRGLSSLNGWPIELTINRKTGSERGLIGMDWKGIVRNYDT